MTDTDILEDMIFYELVADWNREYLSRNPDYAIPSRKAAVKQQKPGKIKVSDFIWYPLYADLSIDRKEIDVVRSG